jgi:long-chain acyl-CoA synthetase
MRILDEKLVRGDITLLSQAWTDERSFCIRPARSGVDEAWLEAALASLPVEFGSAHFALLTSGSTGRPKLVVANKSRSERLARVLDEVQQSQSVEATVVTLPLSYCYALINQWLWAHVMQRKLIMTNGLKAMPQLADVFAEQSAASVCLVGAQVRLLADGLRGRQFPGVIRVHFAGGPFPQTALELVRDLFPNAAIYNNYGCTEAMPRLTLRHVDESEDPSIVGKPLPGISMRSGSAGEILFQSPYGAVGFVDEGAEYVAISESDWVPSGDLGECLPDGMWKIHGRQGQVFKRFGEKISLSQVKDAIAQCWDGEINFYREDDPSGEAGHVLVLQPEPSETQVRGILKALRKAFPRTHWPLRVEGVSTLSLLPNGKIDAVRLAEESKKNIYWRQRL